MVNPLGDIVGTSWSMGNIFPQIVQAVTIIGSILAIAVVAYLIIYFLQFNKKVMLIEVDGGGMRINFDRGKRNKKAKKFSVLQNRSIDFPYPETRDEYPCGRGRIIPFIIKNHSATVIRGISENPHFIPADMDMFAALAARLEQNYELTKGKQSFWDKHLDQVLLLSMITVFLISIIFILQRVDKALDVGLAAAQSAASLSTKVVTT